MEDFLNIILDGEGDAEDILENFEAIKAEWMEQFDEMKVYIQKRANTNKQIKAILDKLDHEDVLKQLRDARNVDACAVILEDNYGTIISLLGTRYGFNRHTYLIHPKFDDELFEKINDLIKERCVFKKQVIRRFEDLIDVYREESDSD